MNDQDYIKLLAEAMGWIFEPSTYTPENGYWNSPCEHLSHYCKIGDVPPFYPFTDANDDYAVLEWMRRGDGDAETYRLFKDAFDDDYVDGYGRWWLYEIGDYARAALSAKIVLERLRINDHPIDQESCPGS